MRKSETYRNEIKSYIVRTGMTMTEVVDYLSDEYGWSRSVPISPASSSAARSATARWWSWQTRWGMTLCGRSGETHSKKQYSNKNN